MILKPIKIMNVRRFICLVTLLIFSITTVFGQNNKADSLSLYQSTPKETPKVISYPKFRFGGLFQGRFISSLNDDIDINGQANLNNEGTLNTFQVKYARVQMRANISERTEIFILTNFADQNKILENASIKYQISPKLALQIGQFRPWFGIEETIPLDVMKSLDRSNQYTEFGKLGWTSFQIGAALLGESKIGNIPFQYSVAVVNGNGRNQIKDNDNGKLFSSRVNFNILKNNLLNVGINGGIGKAFEKAVHTYAADIETEITINSRWNLNLALEAKNAINHTLYHQLNESTRGNIEDYQIRGFYILPDFRYALGPNSRNITAIEFSCRYEIIDHNYKIDSNPKQTFMPMVGLEILKNYGARIQIGARIDRYKHENIAQNLQNNNLLILQVQTRF